MDLPLGGGGWRRDHGRGLQHLAVRLDSRRRRPIRMGRRVNIQDGSILHCHNDVPLDIADEVAVGHNAIVHCRRIGRHTLIGIKSAVLDGAEIGADCIVGAGAVVPPNMKVPDGHLVLGVPGKVIRPVSGAERSYVDLVLDTYERLAREHAAGRYSRFNGRADT